MARVFGRPKAKAALARATTIETSTNARLTVIEAGDRLTTRTVDYVATITDTIILCDATAANMSVTLPNPSLTYDSVHARSLTYNISKIDLSVNKVTILPYATETMAGDTSIVLDWQNDAVTLISDGTNWWIKD